MVIGLDIFKAYFKDFGNNYLIIGGTACDIILEDAGFMPRATDDIDIILIFEALSASFVTKFWEFIKEGGYKLQQKGEQNTNCYRFAKPLNPEFPKQIELFCKIPGVMEYVHYGTHLTPIPVDEGLSSLSAILLNEEYYEYTKQNSAFKNGVHFAKPHTLICLKAYAYLNNKQRKEDGQNIRSVNIVKHKNDVFRMTMMLNEAEVFETPASIKTDLQKFADTIKTDLPHKNIFKSNGIGEQNMEVVFNQFLKSFNLISK